jgi:hypothetical protein
VSRSSGSTPSEGLPAGVISPARAVPGSAIVGSLELKMR